MTTMNQCVIILIMIAYCIADMVVISAAKVKEANWSHVTEFDKKASDSKKLLPDKETEEDVGPEASLMNMMKRM